MVKKYNLFLLIFVAIFTLSACSSSDEKVPKEEELIFNVGGQYLSEFNSFKQNLSYSGIVSPKAKANVVAQVSGTLIDSQINLGDKVSAGQRLARIDDLSSGSRQDYSFNSNQIRQAEIAVSQAKNSYDQAKTNYNNILSSSAKELQQAKINYEQSLKSKDNLNLTSAENLVSAEISYETAQLSVVQAKQNLENQKTQLNQAREDLRENSILQANSTLNTVNTLLTNINNITGFDRKNIVRIPYENNLGALDSSSLIRSKNLYNQTKDKLESIDDNEIDFENLDNLKIYVDDLIILAELTKDLTDATKVLFNKTITSSNLSQNQLTKIQNEVASFQNQANGLVTQIKGVKQSLNNFEIEYKNNIEALEKSYSLALKQEETAKQNLSSLKAGDISQIDQASFSVSLAKNQLENIEIKIQSQISSAKSQVDSAKMQYNNALLTLENLYDSYTLISPLSGVVTKKQFNNGDTINPGELAFSISQTDELKVVFFVEQDRINLLKLGQEITVNNSKATISSLAPQADAISKKYKVEALLTEESSFKPEMVVDVSIDLSRKSEDNYIYFIPLSAININQAGSFIFIYDQGEAKEIEIEIIELIGERAKVEIEDGDNLIIITSGNRRLQSGQLIEVDI